jgi:TPP-dependent trihydroxycyclohexane-1,2-dione (THcHDO) dehydratase
MICDKCGRVFSDKVYEIHYPTCDRELIKEEIKIDQEEIDIRAKAKAFGIKSYHVKSIERLEAEIAELEG